MNEDSGACGLTRSAALSSGRGSSCVRDERRANPTPSPFGRGKRSTSPAPPPSPQGEGLLSHRTVRSAEVPLPLGRGQRTKRVGEGASSARFFESPCSL